jgi:hypothetical protein
MITADQIKIARETWIKASDDLGFNIVTPYFLMVDGRKQEIFAFLPEYGSYKGTFVFLMSPPDYNTDNYLSKWARKRKIFFSFINIDDFLNYDKKYFREILKDWRKYKTLEGTN